MPYTLADSDIMRKTDGADISTGHRQGVGRTESTECETALLAALWKKAVRRRPRPAVYSCMENQEKRTNPGQPIYRVLWRSRQHTLRLNPILPALCLAERESRGSEEDLQSRPTARPSECPRRAGPGSNRGVCVCV